MLSCSLAPMPMLCITKVSSILLRTNQPGKEDRKDSHHKLSALLSLIFGRSSSWCCMTNKATASSIQLECHRIKKSQHPPCVHALMLSCSLAPMPLLCITNVSSILLHANQPGKEDRKDSHHKLSALLSLIFGRSSSWCCMTNKANASSIFLECHRIKKSQHPPCVHALMLSWSLAPMPMLCITKVSSILLHANQPGKEDRKDSHHKLSALLSLIFGRSSSWCSMTNKATASSIQLECHRRKKSQHPPCVHALMLSWSLAPMPMLCITKVSSILLHANQPGKEDRKDSHHQLSALLSLIFGRSSSWCSMTNNLACSLASSRSSLFIQGGIHQEMKTMFCWLSGMRTLVNSPPPKVKKQK